jgi:TolA-binding protein
VTPRSCPDTLLAEGRRRALSDLERHARAAHLAHCDHCKAAELVSQVFHASGDSVPGDAQIVERVAERASTKLAAHSWHVRRSGRRVAVAAGLVLCAGTAAFAWVGGRPRPLDGAAPVATSAKSARPAIALRPQSEVSVAPPADSAAPAPPARAARKRLPPATTDVAPRAVAAAPATAPSLFDEANAMRRAGDLRGAATLYQTLRRRFPDSAEARLSSISLGDVLLDLAEPSGALRAFDAYLAEVRAGSLSEEALFGRARCLRKLGQDRAERETWTTLLRDFPRSGYEPAARRRLEELQR